MASNGLSATVLPARFIPGRQISSEISLLGGLDFFDFDVRDPESRTNTFCAPPEAQQSTIVAERLKSRTGTVATNGVSHPQTYSG